ncbi:MAG TPA: SRPBCC family protein [Myxococcota bacterium]|jgi:ribosome-associated toxin RatA of RatAB toxin-antitoxin module|nr:SRPBCC family protein [Myxococcota bacterium]
MPIVESSITIQAAPDVLFALSQDYYLRKDWDPFVAGIRFLDGATQPAPGVRVWVKSWQGLEMTTEYVTVVPPERVAVKMIEGPRFFETFGGAWHFEPTTPGETRVHFRYSFRSRWPLLRPVLDPVVRLIFGRDIRARLRGLKHAVEQTDITARLGARAR